jgi:SAM-dependent methyltransferase
VSGKTARIKDLMKSYSSQTTIGGLLREAECLYANHLRQCENRVSNYVEGLDGLQKLILSHFGVDLRDMDILDIGPGQFLVQMIYFARDNRVVGIDLDLIAHGFNPLPYAKMLWFNGVRRTLKTVARKLIGIDRRYAKEVKHRLNLASLPKLNIQRMDACRMTFPDASFDFVHSRSVFHHLPTPEEALNHVVRILKPGGIVCLSFHLFTSENGSLDPRVFTEERVGVGFWPHLRASTRNQLTPNAFVNKLRLAEWRRIFDVRMPGAEYILNRNTRPNAEQDAKRLQDNGELAEYTMEELLTDEVILLWRKPLI